MGDHARAMGLVTYLQRAARTMELRMSRLGELGDIPPPPLPEVPAELLDTHSTRVLADELRRAYTTAVAVDRERNWYPNGIAETIGDILALVELDLQAAASPNEDIGPPGGEP